MNSDFEADFSVLRDSHYDNYEEYGRFQQHLVLLEDATRLALYGAAITATLPGEQAVDVGAGTGVLSLMALRHGYRHVFMIEPSRKITEYAKHLMQLNRFNDRFTAITKPLERVAPDELPPQVDLIVTETLSSFILGFGCWDRIEQLANRLGGMGTMIPCRGELKGFLSGHEHLMRTERNGGLRLLKDMGLSVDLLYRTFRSGGNVYDKSFVNYELSRGFHQEVRLLEFDFRKRPMFDLSGECIVAAAANEYYGLTTYWDVALTEHEPAIVLSSRDPAVSAWYPFYVPFAQPIRVQKGQDSGCGSPPSLSTHRTSMRSE